MAAAVGAELLQRSTVRRQKQPTTVLPVHSFWQQHQQRSQQKQQQQQRYLKSSPHLSLLICPTFLTLLYSVFKFNHFASIIFHPLHQKLHNIIIIIMLSRVFELFKGMRKMVSGKEPRLHLLRVLPLLLLLLLSQIVPLQTCLPLFVYLS